MCGRFLRAADCYVILTFFSLPGVMFSCCPYVTTVTVVLGFMPSRDEIARTRTRINPAD